MIGESLQIGGGLRVVFIASHLLRSKKSTKRRARRASKHVFARFEEHHALKPGRERERELYRWLAKALLKLVVGFVFIASHLPRTKKTKRRARRASKHVFASFEAYHVEE